MAPSTEAPLAVLDTNIIIDIFSIGDLLAASQKSAHGQNIDHSSSDLLFRRIRARESLLLAWFFHTKGARTETYGREAVEILSRHVPPQLDPEESSESRFKRNYATVSIWFLKDYILPRWNLTIDRSEPELRGNAADDHLVRLATTYRRPLISNEGFSLTGIDDNHGLRKKARLANIPIYTPGQFWRGNMSEGSAIKRLLARLETEEPKYLKANARSQGAQQALSDRRRLLRYIFFGEVNGGRVSVHLSRLKDQFLPVATGSTPPVSKTQ